MHAKHCDQPEPAEGRGDRAIQLRPRQARLHQPAPYRPRHQPAYLAASGGITYNWKPYVFSISTIYSSGLRGDFADLESLPNVIQIDLSGQRSFQIPRIGEVIDRITLLNVADRTNLIRPAEGIGIFQSAYGPRLTVYDVLTVPLPALNQ